MRFFSMARDDRVPYSFVSEIPNGSLVTIISSSLLRIKGDSYIGIWEEEKWGWGYTRGWNGSYHDAWYDPNLVIWVKSRKGSRFKRLKKLRAKALAWVSEIESTDSAEARFSARRQVRWGD